jgi:hypothetical protein
MQHRNPPPKLPLPLFAQPVLDPLTSAAPRRSTHCRTAPFNLIAAIISATTVLSCNHLQVHSNQQITVANLQFISRPESSSAKSIPDGHYSPQPRHSSTQTLSRIHHHLRR